MGLLTVDQQASQRHARHQNVDSDQENAEIAAVLAAKKVLHTPIFKNLGDSKQVLSSALFKVDMIDQLGLVNLGLFGMSRDDFGRLAVVRDRNNAHLLVALRMEEGRKKDFQYLTDRSRGFQN
jgi:hypothetical protein